MGSSGEFSAVRNTRYIEDDWFKSAWKPKIDKEAETIAIFDCCHSGTTFDLPYVTERTKCEWQDGSAQPKADEPEPFFMYLSGCQDNQKSGESTGADGKRFGAMTRALTCTITDLGPDATLQAFLSSLRKKTLKLNV